MSLGYVVRPCFKTEQKLIFRSFHGMKCDVVTYECLKKVANRTNIPLGPSNRSNSVSSLDLEGESVSELGAGPSGSNGVEALQLLEHEQGKVVVNTAIQEKKRLHDFKRSCLMACELPVFGKLTNDH